MCRSVGEGGRRCPHDSSAARQVRRIKNVLKTEHSSHTNIPVPQTTTDTITDIPAATSGNHVESLTALQGMVGQLDSMLIGNSFPVTVDGVELANSSECKKFFALKIEKQVRQVGADIVSSVEKQTGVTFDSIVEEYNQHVDSLHGETDEVLERKKQLLTEAGEYLNKTEPYSSTMFDQIRLEANENPDNVELVSMVERMDEIMKEETGLRNRVNQTDRGYPETVRQKYSTNIDALLQVLNTVRKFGGKVSTAKQSDRNKTQVVEKIAQYYPEEWLQASNYNPTELVVKKTIGRAHYTHWSKTATVKPLYKLWEYDNGEQPKDVEGAIKLTPDSDGFIKYENEKLGVKIDTHVGLGSSLWLQPQWEYPNRWNHNFNPDGSPKGRGWEPYTHHHTGETAYRRVIKTRESSVDKTKASLLVDSNRNPVNNVEGFDSAIHEMAHRMEAVEIKHLATIQSEFYRRRTTNPDGTSQQQTRLYKNRKEYSITDSFAADYMGKTYKGGTHYEILSTGMEAIFGGDYAGGLIGLKNKNPDHDMRNFIVGVLAGL